MLKMHRNAARSSQSTAERETLVRPDFLTYIASFMRVEERAMHKAYQRLTKIIAYGQYPNNEQKRKAWNVHKMR